MTKVREGYFVKYDASAELNFFSLERRQAVGEELKWEERDALDIIDPQR